MSRNKQGFANVFGAEMGRTLLRPKALIFSALFALMAFGAFAGTLALTNFAARESGEAAALLAETGFIGFSMPLNILSLCFGIYAAAFSARDYNDGALFASLIVVPARGRLFMARLLPWVLVPAFFAALSFGGCLLIDYSSVQDMETTLAQLGMAVLSCLCCSILGFCCGTITKRGSVAVVLYIGIMLVVPMVFSAAGTFLPESFANIASSVNSALPGKAFFAILDLFPLRENNNEAIFACAATAIWTIALPIASFILFKARATLGR